jgi:hypothetical protein
MMGGAGIDSVSSAQSRRAGIGVEHSGAGLGSGGTGGGGRETMAVGGSDASAAVKDGGDGETARRGPSWGKLERMGGEQGVGGFLGRRSGQWAGQGCSVEYTTCFNEHVCSSSHGSVCWATDGRGASVMAW